MTLHGEIASDSWTPLDTSTLAVSQESSLEIFQVSPLAHTVLTSDEGLTSFCSLPDGLLTTWPISLWRRAMTKWEMMSPCYEPQQPGSYLGFHNSKVFPLWQNSVCCFSKNHLGNLKGRIYAVKKKKSRTDCGLETGFSFLLGAGSEWTESLFT